MITNEIEKLSDNKFLYDLKRSNMKLIVISINACFNNPQSQYFIITIQ